MLLLTLFSRSALSRIRYRYSLFDRLTSVYFRLDVLAERGFACRFNKGHTIFPLTCLRWLNMKNGKINFQRVCISVA